MQVCFYCSNDIDSGAEGFIPSSGGKCDACLENCSATTQGRKRSAVRDLPYCTAAVSRNGLSTVISADGSFSRPVKPVSLSLNDASSFERLCVDQTRQGAILDGQSSEEFTHMCDQQEDIESQLQNEAAVRALVEADYASKSAKTQASQDKRFYLEFGSYSGLISTPAFQSSLVRFNTCNSAVLS